MGQPNVFRMRFDGRILRRGFWLYVWDIRSERDRILYVGRTGDSSSANASSPFSRIGHHLNFKDNAKANSMARLLAQSGVDPEVCEFSMVAIGPLFPEQPDFSSHAPIRDRVAALEGALARHLRARGYTVLGRHGGRALVDEALWAEIAASVDDEFPIVTSAV